MISKINNKTINNSCSSNTLQIISSYLLNNIYNIKFKLCVLKNNLNIYICFMKDNKIKLKAKMWIIDNKNNHKIRERWF